jgi:pimeloyl-ACP methyl ester carboxylesterase
MPKDSNSLSVQLSTRQIGSGPTVVCLHSSGSSSTQWRSLTTQLAREHRVIAPDFLGHGRSPRSDVAAGPILDQDAAHVAELIADVGPVHLVGHSYGGAVALRVALTYPQRVGSLTVYEPVVFGMLRQRAADADLWQEIRQTGHTIALHAQMRRLLQAGRAFVDYWSGPGRWRTMGAQAQTTIALRMPEIVRHFWSLFAWPLNDDLRSIAMPILLLQGGRTRRVAARVTTRLAQALPQAQHTVVAPAGHMGPITHGDAVDRQIAGFIDQVERGTVALAEAA